MKLMDVPSVAAPGAETEKWVAPVTVNTSTGEVTPPWAAVMLVLPGETPVACPWVPEELLMEPTPVFEEFHVTVVVRFC